MVQDGLLQVGRCAVSQLFGDAGYARLVAENAEECWNAIAGTVCPNLQMYAALEASGLAAAFGAYRDGALVGYAFVVTSPLPHSGLKYACVESLFVTREARRGVLGQEMLEALDAYATEQGCHAILYSAPVGSRFAKLMFLRDDTYVHSGHTFLRGLK